MSNAPSRAPGSFAIRPEDPGEPGVAALLAAGEAFSASLYPAESNHIVPLDALRGPHVTFLVARDEAGRAVGTGAMIAAAGEAAGEIKRMWVEPDWRGSGLAAALLAWLEEAARGRGLGALRLETGVVSHAALRLYERSGYVRRGPFGGYGPDPLSVFMEKALV
jgi:putative acetyltransferase